MELKFRLKTALMAVAAAGFAAAAMAVGKTMVADGGAGLKGHVHVHVAGNDDWALDEPHRGLYSVNTATGELTQECENNQMTAGNAGIYIKGRYYVSNSSTVGTMMINGVNITVYDAATGEQTDKKNLQAQWLNRALAYAYDGVNDEAWAVTNGGTGTTYALSKFDYDNLAYTPKVQLKQPYTALATDGEGHFYGILQGTADLYLIDTATGNGERITSAAFIPQANMPQSLTWSPADGLLLWTATSTSGETLITAFNPDPDNTRCEEVCSLGNARVQCIYTTDPYAPAGAPAAAENVSVKYDEPGALAATVEFTVPGKTVGGDNLEGEITATVVTDGNADEAKTLDVNPGETAKVAVELTEGNHKVDVRLQNAEGKSEPVTVYTYAGFDTPKAVANLTYETGQGGSVILSWDEPEGVNGGTLEKLTYRVSRNGTEIATVETTTFEDKVEGALSVYRYTVVPVAGNKTGEAATTDKIVLGDALALPYHNDFATEDEFSLFTVLDANNDGTTWSYMSYYKCVQYQRKTSSADGDDYLMTPAVKLTAGHVYSFRFVSANNATKPEQLSVLLAKGTSLAAALTAEVIMEKKDFTNRTDEETEVLFTPEADGDYSIGIHYTTPAASGLNINIKSIDIEDIGRADAPAAVSNLSAVPGADGSLEATISFKTPATDFDGNAISELEKVVVSRNGSAIKTFDAPAVGTELTFDDKEVPEAAFYTYAVTAYNANGAGRTVDTRLYVGAAGTPAIYPLDTEESAAELIASDADNDGQVWHYDTELKGMAYTPTKAGQAKDYIITRMINLKKGETVRISFDQQPADMSETVSPGNCPSLWVGIGSGSYDASVTTIYPAVIVRPAQLQNEEREYKAPADGIYFVSIGVNGYMYSPNPGVVIRNLRIDGGIESKAPRAVEALSVEGDKNGELKGVFSFIMPKLATDGTELDGTVDATLYNQANRQIGTVTGQPGEKVSIEAEMLRGLSQYTVYTSNAAGIGARATIKARGGFDVPRSVHGLFSNPSADNMSTELSWDEPTESLDGGWYDASQLRYSIELYDEATGQYNSIATTTDLSYEFKTEDSEQKTYRFVVLPMTDAGKGIADKYICNFLGKPFALPFEENFEGGEKHSSPWFTEGQFETVDWRVKDAFSPLGVTAEDGGMLVLSDNYSRLGEASVRMPKLSLQGCRRPVLSFDMFHYNEAKSYVDVEISTDETNFTTLVRLFPGDYIELPDNPQGLGWKREEIDLNDYVNYQWVSLRLSGLVASGNEAVVIDGIKVADEYTTSIGGATTGGATVRVVAGGIVVENAGGSRVDVYGANGAAVYTRSGMETVRCNLASGVYVVKIGEKSVKVVVR